MAKDTLLAGSVSAYLEQLALQAPTPGGGSAAALTGALAAGLGRMVVAFTSGKAKFAQFEDRLRTLADRLARAQALFEKLVDEDAIAYGVLSDAFMLDKSDPGRKARIAAAAQVAASVPLETATTAHAVLLDVRKLREVGNPLLGADIEAAEAMAQAAIRAAAANVQANLPLMEAEDADVFARQLSGVVED